MRIVLLRDECGNGRTCPNINSTDRGSYVLQGYRTASAHTLAPGQAWVEVPLSLLPELVSTPARSGLSPTDRGTVLVRGTEVTDPGVLADLNLPEGENAVEVPRAALPELQVTDAR